MLHEETVEALTLALIRRLTANDFLKDFFLVGDQPTSFFRTRHTQASSRNNKNLNY